MEIATWIQAEEEKHPKRKEGYFLRKCMKKSELILFLALFTFLNIQIKRLEWIKRLRQSDYKLR